MYAELNRTAHFSKNAAVGTGLRSEWFQILLD
jgi:hypothetical protein